MQSILGSLKTRAIASLFAVSTVFAAAPAMAASPLETTLEDFEAGTTSGASPVDPSNSPSAGASNSVLSNVTEAGSQRLRLQDADGTYNGAVITIPNAIPMAGYYLITADVKVDNSTGAINSFGMAAVAGGTVTAEVLDTNAGYVMNLSGSGDAAKGYQTIGAQIQVPEGGTFPRDMTLYFSSDVSSFPTGAAADGDFNRVHRASATDAWTAGNSNSVYIDNIKRIGPGNIGEERHLWISVGDGYTNLNQLENILVSAKQNNFNVVDILARYRSDAYYVPNRTNNTYPNPEQFGTKIGGINASATNDPLQYAIDRGHELGLKVYISFSAFLVTDTTTYPSYMPSGSIQWFYNSGSPRQMLSTDAGSEGLWADPARADVRAHTKNVLMDIITNYDVDGVVFDRIRYPGQNFGYNPTGLSQMASNYGLVTSPTLTPTNASFRDARREVIANFLQECYASITTAKPWVVVSATPVNTLDNMVDTYNQYFQYWPKWTAKTAPNRAISFGVLDNLQPQFYRLWNTISPYQAPASNQRLMDKARFGDTATLATDMGLMPGSNINLAPLFYHPNSPEPQQSAANSQNAVDTRTRGFSGFGFFNASKVIPDINGIRSTGNNTAGVDILAQPVATTDYLQKANYDNVLPKAVTGLTATPNVNGTVQLTWNAPAPAIDGESAAKYLVYSSTVSPVKEYWANLLTKTPLPAGQTSFTVPATATGNYYYKVIPVDDYNNHGASATRGPVAVNGSAIKPEVIIDNPQATLVGAWTVATSSGDRYGANYAFRGRGTGANSATFTATIPQDGTYDIFEFHPAGTNRSSGAPHIITTPAGQQTVAVNQQINGGKWNKIGTGTFTAGQSSSVKITDGGPANAAPTATNIMADAIRWQLVNQLPGTPTAPGGLAAVGYGSSTINLTWFDNASEETSYQVLRSQTTGGAYTVIANLPANSTSYSDTNLVGGNYYYVVRAINAAGNSLNSNESWAHVPVPAPSAPEALTGSLSGCTTAHLEWVPTADIGMATDQYVLRATSESGPFEAVAQIGPLVPSYDDFDLLNGATYYYQVLAANGDVVSAVSNTLSVATPALPAVPSDLGGNASSQTEISLTWQDNASNELNYEIVRDGNVIATLDADATSFSDSGLTADTAYTYSVRATSTCGNSADSNSAVVSTLPNPPAAPSNLAVSASSATQVDLTWVDNASNEQGFEVLRNGAIYATVDANATSYSDTAAGECTVLTYTVRAFNAGGRSSDSNEVSISIDVTDPTITAPADESVNTDTGVCAATVTVGTPVTGDNCEVASVSSDAPATFPVGTRDVTWTVTDGHGNTATAVQKITVTDSEAPSITAPANVTVGTDAGQAVATNVALGTASTSDNCGVASTSNDAPSQYPIGTTTVTWTVTDVHGNVNTATQTVTVEDREDPVLACPADIEVGASLSALVPVTFDPIATDNSPGVTVVSTPASGSGFPVGTTTVNVTATDASGNVSTCSFKVVRAAVSFTGFLSPIGGSVGQGTGGSYAAPVRIFKLNSTIPVKMQLAIDGAAVLTGVHTLQAIKFDSAAAPGTPIDATPTDAATSGNQFRLTGNEWHYNLSTKGLSQGTWKLVATLADGSKHEVWVDLK